jgi:protein SCO1/2
MNLFKKCLIFLLLVLNSNFIFSQDNEIGIIEHLSDSIAEDIYFINETYDTVYITQLIDKPTVITMVYFRCPGICSPLLGGVAEVIDRCDLLLGKDYQVITISFDPDENPAMAKEKKINYLTQVEKKIDEKSWIWLTGNEENIKKLTQTIGFNYKKQGNEYIHTAGIIILNSQAKIARYLYGTYFIPKDLEMAIDEAAQNKFNPSVRKMQKYCFTEEPEGRTYISVINKITGGVVLLAALIFFGVLIIKKKKNDNTTS